MAREINELTISRILGVLDYLGVAGPVEISEELEIYGEDYDGIMETLDHMLNNELARVVPTKGLIIQFAAC